MNSDLLAQKVNMFCNTYKAFMELPDEWLCSDSGQLILAILDEQKAAINAEVEEFGREIDEMRNAS